MEYSVVSREEWLEARKALLAKEKELTRQRDRVNAERLALPWVRVEKDYCFQSPKGDVSLADLFDGRSQLMINHFMFHPDWDAGCEGCPSSPITSTACCRISTITMSPWSPSPARRFKRSRPTSAA
jgi:predicted dithiol-disulfide oxidoreductase (DUF899 family)